MAKKVRTPPPPRRVQAPKRRESPPSPDAARRQRMILFGLAGSGIVLLGAVLLFLVFAPKGGGDDNDVAAAVRAAGGTFRTSPSEGRTHVQDPNAKVDYKTDPPTSGSHYGIPAVWGLYDRPINQVQAVHNLEHGGIIIQYGDDVSDADVRQIEAFYRDSPNGMLVAPLPRLGDQIALTAWTHLAKLPRFDEAAFEEFRDAYRARGPENPPFSLDDLQPGGT